MVCLVLSKFRTGGRDYKPYVARLRVIYVPGSMMQSLTKPAAGSAMSSMDALFNSSCFTAEQIGDHREFMKHEGNESTKQIYVYNAHQRETEVYSSQEVSAIAELCKCAASPPRQLRLGGIVGCFLTQFMGGVNMILLPGLIFNVELDYYGPCI